LINSISSITTTKNLNHAPNFFEILIRAKKTYEKLTCDNFENAIYKNR